MHGATFFLYILSTLIPLLLLIYEIAHRSIRQHLASHRERSRSRSQSARRRPRFDDVYKCRWILMRNCGLPMELAEMIMDHAEYWPSVADVRARQVKVQASKLPTNQMAKLVALAPALPVRRDGRSTRVRRVVVRTRSRDQGWCDDRAMEGTYRGSWSEFWACILRPANPKITRPPHHFDLDAQYPFNSMDEAFDEISSDRTAWRVVEVDGQVVWKVQSNVTAALDFKNHVVTWRPGVENPTDQGQGDGKGFIEALRPGDRVGIWARAIRPGRANEVENVSAELAFSL